MTTDEARAVLAAEGYTDIHEWHDAPWVIYPSHAHHWDTAHIVVSGAIFVRIGDEETEYTSGDRFDIPANIPHAARMGSDGCTYIFGEKV